ncbi:MAG TPA: hypothetical protein PLN31_03265 [Azoarcus taiwanensis]|nr:hypothetical protein [Azoarcus taiwanensis]
MSAIPQRYLEIINPLIAQARAFLEKGEPLAPIAFVGNFTTGAIAPVAIATDTIDAKDRIADSIRLLAGQMDADFVFLLMEAYSLRPDKVPRYEEIIDEYGSLANCPANWRMEVVSLTLETLHGVWVAQPMVKPKGVSKKKRTFGTPEFRHFTEVQGRFVDLLPAKAAMTEGSGRLH